MCFWPEKTTSLAISYKKFPKCVEGRGGTILGKFPLKKRFFTPSLIDFVVLRLELKN